MRSNKSPLHIAAVSCVATIASVATIATISYVATIPYVVSGFSRTVSARQYTFEEVASGLEHQNPDTRLRAIQILRDADYPEAAAPIGKVLGDSDDRVQLAAIAAERSLFTLRPISRRSKVGFVVERRSNLASGDVMTDAQLALKPRRVPPEVLTGLVLALSDQNPQVRNDAIALAALIVPVACDIAAAPVERPFEQLCGQIGNVLIENINSRESAVRRAAMVALGRLRYANAVQALSDQLSFYQTGADARAALEGLAGIGHGASVTTFEQLLSSSSADSRRLGVEGLARAGRSEALPQLQTLGQSERSNEVLLALHFANVKLGVPGESVAHLLTAAGVAALRPTAVRYLLELAPLASTQLAAALRDVRPEIRRIAADVLGFSSDPMALAALAAAEQDSDPGVAAAAGRAIERIKLR